MRALLVSLALCVAVAVIVFAVSEGHVILLPLVLLLPLAFFSFGRRG
ncbi:MAG TPA: hypothetical protein VFT86_10375 [Gaiellaceae bacterium]|nr:hypothetical protein [Gaiellaceae bacterium]